MISVKSKNPWKYAVFAIVLCLMASAVIYPILANAEPVSLISADGQTVKQLRTINVTGSADVMVAPDEVEITVGIETRNADFNKAKSENEENAKKVIDLTKKYGIEAKYVQSDYIRTYPSYEYQNYSERSKVSFYNIQKRIIIKLKEIEKFETLVSDLMSNGTIMVQNIDFRTTELSKYRNEARKLAINAARDKAKLLTSELECGIAKPITINEEQINNWSWYGSWWGSSWYGYNQPNAASNVLSNYQSVQDNSGGMGNQGQTGETVAIGQIKITARINVVFELN